MTATFKSPASGLSVRRTIQKNVAYHLDRIFIKNFKASSKFKLSPNENFTFGKALRFGDFVCA